MRIFFYNHYHNGDIFYSKEFVKDIKNMIGDEHYYLHTNDQSILKDVDVIQLRMDLKSAQDDNVKHNGISLKTRDIVIFNGGDVYINTWVGNDLSYDCSLKSNYLIYSDIYEKLGLKIKHIKNYIPSVNFDLIDKKNINKHNFRKSVLVCDNKVLSFQSVNFDFGVIIRELSTQFRNIDFIVTNGSNFGSPNVINSNSIIGFETNNLLEISYLSTKVDLIVGRASGPFCFTHIKDNMHKNKIFVSFTKNENDGKWVSDELSNANQIWYNNFDKNYIIDELKKIIREFL